MLLGLDVGGTCTDAVLLDENRVLAWSKAPTRDDLLSSLLEALDSVTDGIDKAMIDRVVLSTTLITNLIAEKKYDPVGLVLSPGPGLNHDWYNFNTETRIVGGIIDYRGREIKGLDLSEVDEAIEKLGEAGCGKVAVVGKFSPRNNKHERIIKERIENKHPEWKVDMGHQVAGQLNFPRRVMSSLLTCATREKYQFFVSSVIGAMENRGLSCPVFILKADGGTLPLKYSLGAHMDTMLSGPAASCLGAQALVEPGVNAVVIDIGGTTSDLAIILSGQPLLSSKGASIEGRHTHVRTMAVKSVPVGGDTEVIIDNGTLSLSFQRAGDPYCLGGSGPTPTDAMKVLGFTEIGDMGKARESMANLGLQLGLDEMQAARKVIGMVAGYVAGEVRRMFTTWEQEPAYRVWEVLQKRKVHPDLVIGAGGGAPGIIPAIALHLGSRHFIPPYAAIANAIGAAVARPTISINLRADTEQGTYSVLEEGYQGPLTVYPFSLENGVELSFDWLKKRSARFGLGDDPKEVEIIRREVFNIVRDWITRGRLIEVEVQTRRGILCNIRQEEVKGR